MAKARADQDLFEGTNHLELIAVCVLIVSVALHSLLIFVHKITRKHRNVAQMLDRMFNELMILGLISTVLYFCEQSNLFSHDEAARIHQIHLTLFFTVIGWVFTSVLLMATSIYISFTWTKSEELIPEHHRLQKEHEQIKKELDEVMFLWRPFYIKKWIRKSELTTFFNYYGVRQQFIDANHLPKSYNFGYYLRKCKRHVFLTLGGIHTTAWITVAFVLLLDMMYRNYIAILSGGPTIATIFDIYANGALIFLSSVMTALSLIVYYKCTSILKHLQMSDIIKFDALANNYIIRVNFEDGMNDDLEFDEESTMGGDSMKPARLYHHDKWVHGEQSRDVIQGHAVVLSESKYEYRPNRQQEMFWFGSHIVLLRFIQSILALMVITCSIMVSQYVLGGEVLYAWTPLVVIILFIFVFMSIASAIPIYTIIVHIGELADIKTAREAARKIEQRRLTLKQAKKRPIPAKITLANRLERILISSWMESLIQWLIIVNLVAVAIPLVFPTNTLVNLSGNVITMSITTFFLLEVFIRGKILGFTYFLIDWWTVVDAIVVVASFLASVFQFWFSIADITTVLLGMRLLESGRVWRIARKIKRARAVKQYRESHPDPWDYSKEHIPMQAESDTQDQNSESEMSTGIHHRHEAEESQDVTIDESEQRKHQPRVLDPASVIVNLDQGPRPDL